MDKMAVFENCEGRQAMNSGKFQVEEERYCVCDFEVSECTNGILHQQQKDSCDVETKQNI
jgi:hypothetical protein